MHQQFVCAETWENKCWSGLENKIRFTLWTQHTQIVNLFSYISKEITLYQNNMFQSLELEYLPFFVKNLNIHQ